MHEDSLGGSNKSYLFSALRWIALLPGALLAAILAMFPIHWLLVLLYQVQSLNSDTAIVTVDGKPVPFFGIPFETLERSVIGAIIPIIFILVGVCIAPARKWTTAVVLAVLWILLMTVTVTFVLSTDRFEVDLTFTTFLVLGLNTAGTIYALRTAFLEHGPTTATAVDGRLD